MKTRQGTEGGTMTESDHDSSTRPTVHYLEWSTRGRPGIVRYAIGAVLVLALSLLVGQMFAVVGKLLIPWESPAATVVKTTFFGFIVSFLLLPLVPWLLNRRPWWSIAMPRLQFDWRNLLIGIGAAVAAHLVIQVVGYVLYPGAYSYSNPDLGTWLPMLLIAAVAFFVQASTEEMVYRGYLAQFTRRLLRHPAAVIVVPALVFALPHYGNLAGLEGPLGLTPYVVIGLGYGWLAFRSGSLWLSAGAHLGGNWFITCFFGSSGERIEKISLFTVTSGSSAAPWGATLSQLAVALMICGLAEVVLRRTGRIVGIPG